MTPARGAGGAHPQEISPIDSFFSWCGEESFATPTHRATTNSTGTMPKTQLAWGDDFGDAVERSSRTHSSYYWTDAYEELPANEEPAPDEADPDIDKAELIGAVGRIAAMKVTELRNALKAHGLCTTGKKPELAARLVAATLGPGKDEENEDEEAKDEPLSTELGNLRLNACPRVVDSELDTSAMKVAELRDALKARALPAKGKKAELKARLDAALADEAPGAAGAEHAPPPTTNAAVAVPFARSAHVGAPGFVQQGGYTSHLVIERGGTVARLGRSHWVKGAIACTRSLGAGEVALSVQLVAGDMHNLFVGLIKADKVLPGSWIPHEDTDTFLMEMHYGGLWGNGCGLDKKAGPLVPGDVLRVERTATGDVAFFRNGKPHGPGFTDADGNGCHGDVKLCVEMGEAGQQVQLQYDALYA